MKPDPERAVPVVAIGASAGGLQALRQLLERVPADTGLAFVVIQHLEPTRHSLLSSVLAGVTSMPVVEAADGMRLSPDRVHVMPAGSDLEIAGRVLTLLPRDPGERLHLPIDRFLRALADDEPGRSIGVVLSGTGSDGTDGLGALKAAGGMTFAQTPETAEFTGMPVSAITAGVVDHVLPPAEIASELVRLSGDAWLLRPEPSGTDDAAADDEGTLEAVLESLRRYARFDFRGYKRPTIRRRIARRTALRKLGSAAEYAELVSRDATEAKALADDLLVHVTSFFRDPPAFEALEQKVLAEIVRAKADGASVRVWVPGCSTGEEAYSIALALLERVGLAGRNLSIRVFGTDLSESAIQTARAGVYTSAALVGVSPERLSRYFDAVDGGYRIAKHVRELCVFVQHDLTRDPPFARLDLVSCRNVLIYFNAELQRRILPLLHHCLLRPGYLFLGTSEGIGPFAELFGPIDARHRLFVKTGEATRFEYPATVGNEAELDVPAARAFGPTHPVRDAQRKADHVLLARYAPPGVVVDETWEVVQFRGRTGPFLEPAPGHPQAHLLKMARDGLQTPLREALEQARADALQVRREGVRIEDGQLVVDLVVTPLQPNAARHERRFFLIVFEEVGPGGRAVATRPSVAPAETDLELARLRAELAATRDYLQATMGEHQDTTDALAAANEELVSANEELQATNEELQSAKEELQSTNEELTTVNDELRLRNQELDVVANDLVNVLDSVEIAVIIVDANLRVRRFTPTVREVSTLMPNDVGRSIDDVKFKVHAPDLVDRIRQTLASATPQEWEVEARDGRWFRLNVRPFHTRDLRADGAVLSFIDIDALKRIAQEAVRARHYAERVVQTVPTPLLVVDDAVKIVSANPSFQRTFGPVPPGEPALFELSGGAWGDPGLRGAIARAMSAGARFDELPVRVMLPPVGPRELMVSGCPLAGEGGDRWVLLAIEDVSERLLLERSERQARVDAEQANRAKDLFLATLSHELRTPLGAILMSAQLLQRVAADDPRIERSSRSIVRAVANQARLIDDLLDISRIVSGKLVLDLQAVDLASVVLTAVDVARPSSEAKGVALTVAIDDLPGPVHGDPVRLQQIVANLVNNAIKFTPRGGWIEVRLAPIDGRARITVADNGIGIRADLLPVLFDRFVQAESSMTRAHGGLGLGLAIVAHLVNVHGGEVRAESVGEGHGSTFTVTLPLAARDAAARPPSARALSVTRGIEGVRVLLVEDDDDTREASASMLAAFGAEVRATASVAEGLVALDAFAPDAILCDLAMPGADGFAFIRAVRARGEDRGGRVPAAALTALASEEDRRRALEAGFQLHLPKPIDASRLADAVAKLSSRARLAPDAGR